MTKLAVPCQKQLVYVSLLYVLCISCMYIYLYASVCTYRGSSASRLSSGSLLTPLPCIAPLAQVALEQHRTEYHAFIALLTCITFMTFVFIVPASLLPSLLTLQRCHVHPKETQIDWYKQFHSFI